MKNVLMILATVALLAACGDQPAAPAATALQSFDACSCATVTDKASADFEKCKELRMKDAKFEEDFQKCLVAKGDTTNVKLVDQNQIPTATAGGYSINVGESSIGWTGTKKLGGKKHNGTIAIKSGNIAYDGSNITGGEIVIDMRSLTNKDLSGDGKAKLEGHLKSDDFFAVEKHPEARFVIKSAKSKGGVSYEVNGDLTIKGITKPAKADLVVAKNGDTGVSIGGALVFNRADFDVRYGSDSFFDNVPDGFISNEVILTVNIKAAK
jgi:polyisoprenoid-binding protein YceI